MRDPSVIELRPVGEKAGALVETDGVRLGMEYDVRIRALLRLGDEGIEDCTTDAMAAAIREHRHTTDLYAAVTSHVEPPGTDGLRIDERQRVHGGGIVAIVLVDFDVRRNVLFIDENGEANGARAAHASEIVDGKKFYMGHAFARVSPSAASILHGVSQPIIRVASALLVRTGRVLLVASRYEGRAEPLWFLPGGRPKDGELLHEAVVRETAEETGLVARVVGLRYVSESISPRGVHIVNSTFGIEADGEPRLPAAGSDHIVDFAFVPIPALRAKMSAKALWEPLFAHLCDALPMHYAGYPDSDFEPPALQSDENLT